MSWQVQRQLGWLLVASSILVFLFMFFVGMLAEHPDPKTGRIVAAGLDPTAAMLLGPFLVGVLLIATPRTR